MENVLVDDADSALLLGHRWRIITFRTKRGRIYQYVESKIDGKHVLFHRLLLAAPDGMVVDHINGNGLDNRRCNLRLCSHSENMRNRKINANHAYGYKGVGRRSKGGRFYAEIRAGSIRMKRGGFETAEEASIAYAEMATALHGEFAQF